MNIDELALEIASDCGLDTEFIEDTYKEYARALIAEYEAAGSEPVAFYDGRKFYGNKESASMCCADMVNLKALYVRPDPRVSELEAQHTKDGVLIFRLDKANRELEAEVALHKLANINMQVVLTTHVKQNTALLVAIEVITHKLKPYPKLAHNTGYFHLQEFFDEVLTLSPSTELLEDRDRKRDAKLLREAVMACDSIDDGVVSLHDLAAARESGEWQPLLDGK